MDKVKEYLSIIDQVIEKGNYEDDWRSLSQFEAPTWYKNAKFGLFVHWGVYSVPAFGDEWYPRRMYLTETPEYAHHIATYGPHKDFGYKDFIPLFKGEKFDAEAWATLFESSGARYITPVAEHHDGFQMYDSELSVWNSVNMGPKVDFLGELKQAVESKGMTFCASSHRAENYWFFSGARTFDSGIKDSGYQEPYGYNHWLFDQSDQDAFTHDIESEGPSKAHLDDWLARTCEIVDKYQPQLMYFDWWIMNMAFKPYLKKFAAYYYNRSKEWGKEVGICHKHDAFLSGVGIYDIERGQASDIRRKPWQTDTAIGLKSWGYTEDNEYKTPEMIIHNLVDVVSKNGCLMLNVGPKADGSIGAEDQSVLKAIGQWLEINGDAIYDSECWHIYGEGPTKAKEGYFNDSEVLEYTSEDLRFTYKAPYIYVTVMSWPKDGKLLVKSLGTKSHLFSSYIDAIDILGYAGSVFYEQLDTGLWVECIGHGKTSMPVCIRIKTN